MARLIDEYPDVFEEWVSLFDTRGESFEQRRERTRSERVALMFRRMRR